jgi:hypothetical protein
MFFKRDRSARYRPWPERTHQDSVAESDSLIAVCAMSLAGLATSLFVVGSPRTAAAFSHGSAIAVLEAGIIAAAVCAVVAVAGRSDKSNK